MFCSTFFLWSVYYDFVSVFIHLKTLKKKASRTQNCIFVVGSIEKLNIIAGKFLPWSFSLCGQSGDISLCHWALVLWMKGSLVSRITEPLWKTNVPQLTNEGEKWEWENIPV